MPIAFWPENRAWSWSALEAFELCPENYFQTKVSKAFAEPDREGLGPGKEVHKLMENYVKYGYKLPPGLTKFGRIVDQLSRSAREVVAEGKGGLTSDGSACEWKPPVSCRLVIDFMVVYKDYSVLVDWKTSSQPRESEEQLKLYCMYLLQRYPKHRRAHAGFAYTQPFPSRTVEVHRDQLPTIAARFQPRIEALDEAFKTNIWQARPCFKCEKWCPVTSCAFHGKRNR